MIGPVLNFARRLAGLQAANLASLRPGAGLTDNPRYVEHLAAFAGGLGNVERVDVLPFHQMGEHKWKKLGIRVQTS